MHVRLRKKMAAGQPLLGVQMLIHHPTVMEIAGWCGADYVLVDGEHATVPHSALEAIVRAAELANIVPVIRTFMHAGTDLLPYLDLGFRGVMVPHLKTAEQAKEMVRFTRFPPWGERTFSPGRVSRYFLHKQTQDELKTLSDSILIIAQLEDAEAIKNLDALLEIEGIDIYNIGPADLAGSLGHPGDPEHEEVRGAIRTIIAAAGRKGRFSTNRGWDEVTQREFFVQGARNFFVADTDVLIKGFRDRIAHLRVSEHS